MTINQEADALINGARQEKYGHALDNWTRTVNTFNALMVHKLKEPLTPADGLIFMVCVKLAREVHCHQRDSIVDIAGYCGCIEQVIEEREKRGA